MSERPSQAELDEANASRCQELELALEAANARNAQMLEALTGFRNYAALAMEQFKNGRGHLDITGFHWRIKEADILITSSESSTWLADKLAAAEQRGYDSCFQGWAESRKQDLADAEQRGRDKVLKELSEQEPVAWLVPEMVDVGVGVDVCTGLSFNKVDSFAYSSTPLIPRPLPPEVKGE